MTKEEAFILWAEKHDVSDGLPWEVSKDLLKTVFSAGWDAKTEADKQTTFVAIEPVSVFTPVEIYQEYPRHVGRAAAIKAIEKAVTKIGAGPLMQAVKEYASAVKTWAPTARYTAAGVDTVPHPATWFNQERWTDDRSEWVKNAAKHTPSQFGRTYQ